MELYDTVFTTEGWADALTFGKYGTSTQGWHFSNYQKGAYMRSPCKNLVFVPDSGMDGQGHLFYHHAVKVAQTFLDVKEQVFVLDLNQSHLAAKGKDANAIGRKTILEEFKHTEPLTFESAMNILSA